MRARWLSLSLLLVCTFAAPAVMAEGKGDKGKKADAAEKKKDAKPDGDGVRRDPKGVTGVTPLIEALAKGDAAYASKDWDKAIEGYKDAIGKDAKSPLGHYRLGEAHLAAGKLDDAGQAWQDALKAASERADAAYRAKALFVIADLKERQGKWDEAATAWKEYGSYVTDNPKAKGYAATATERQKAIETHNDVAAKAAKVKERIQQREKEQQEQAAQAAAQAEKLDKKKK
jgi:tetratricopeptide (TPR) repeat protein